MFITLYESHLFDQVDVRCSLQQVTLVDQYHVRALYLLQEEICDLTLIGSIDVGVSIGVVFVFGDFFVSQLSVGCNVRVCAEQVQEHGGIN